VDDSLTAADTMEGVEAGKKVLAEKYKVRDMGELKDFLGLRFERHRPSHTLFLSAPGHTASLLDKYNMADANPNNVSMAAGSVLGRDDTATLADPAPFMELVGSLLYLDTTTRPDLAYATEVLARFMKEPQLHHWQAAKAVLRYLAGTKGMGLRYSGGAGLTGAVDASYGDCPTTRRSTTGWAFSLNGAAISWTSKRQTTVAASTAEAEYVAAAAATKEALWLRKLMADLELPDGTVLIAEDNAACRSMANNPEGTGRAKHIDIAHHLVRERTASGEVKLVPLAGADQPADGLTKPLPEHTLACFRKLMGVADQGSNAEDDGRTKASGLH